MKDNKKNWVWNAIFWILVLGCLASPALADDDAPSPQTAEATGNPEKDEPAVYFETEGDFYLGYRWVNTNDSLKAAEYIYPYSSVSFGLNLLSCPLPYRYHVNAEFISPHDFYADAGFAYRDLVLFRDILVGVPHNLGHFNYQLPGEPPDFYYTEKDPDRDYYTDFASNLMSLRLKTPNFPFHVFGMQRHIEQEGNRQQRYLLGYFGDLNKVSESRDIEWTSNEGKIGANSHLGPVELEYTYDGAKFDPGSNNILYDYYPAADDRPADVYPHNVIPETRSWANSIKMHSSYTGGIVAAATISNLIQKNDYSLTESTTWKGAFDLSWIPAPVMGLFFKYRHRDVDTDTPAEVTLTGVSNVITYPVREGISYDKDVFTLSARYKPLSRLSLFADYEFAHLERENVADWILLPQKSNVQTIDLRAHARLHDKVKVTAKYEYLYNDEPAYNTVPDNSNYLKLTTTYLPSPTLNVYLEYILALTERDDLRYLNSDPAVLLENGEYDGRREQFLASLTKGFTPKLSLTLSWFYQRWKVEQDLAYGQWLTTGAGDLPYYDYGVPYTDRANSFSLSLNFIPREDITVTSDLTYTITKGTVEFSDVIGEDPFSLASYSELEAAETRFSLDVAKKFARDWELGLRFYMNVYNDMTTDLMDGNIFTTTFALKRYF